MDRLQRNHGDRSTKNHRRCSARVQIESYPLAMPTSRRSRSSRCETSSTRKPKRFIAPTPRARRNQTQECQRNREAIHARSKTRPDSRLQSRGLPLLLRRRRKRQDLTLKQLQPDADGRIGGRMSAFRSRTASESRDLHPTSPKIGQKLTKARIRTYGRRVSGHNLASISAAP